MSNSKTLFQNTSVSSIGSLPTPLLEPMQIDTFPRQEEQSDSSQHATSILLSPLEKDKNPRLLLKSCSIQEEKKLPEKSLVTLRNRSKSGATKIKRVEGSIIIESCHDPSVKSNSIEFNEDLYNKIEGFLDEEGLDIIEAETFRSGFFQVLKIMVVENPENEGKEENSSLQRKLSCPVPQLDTISSKLFLKRRASANDEQTFSTPSKNFSYDGPMVGMPKKEKEDEIKQKYQSQNKNKLATLLSVGESRQELESGVFDSRPPTTMESSSPKLGRRAKHFVESLENIVSDGLKKPLVKFIPRQHRCSILVANELKLDDNE